MQDRAVNDSVIFSISSNEEEPSRRKVHPPPSGRHAMRCLYVIGRDSWVWETSSTYWLDIDSSHGVGEYSVNAVCPRAGGLSRRRLSEIIVVVWGSQGLSGAQKMHTSPHEKRCCGGCCENTEAKAAF